MSDQTSDRSNQIGTLTYSRDLHESPFERNFRLSIGWFCIFYPSMIILFAASKIMLQYKLMSPIRGTPIYPLDVVEKIHIATWFVISTCMILGGVRLLQLKIGNLLLLRIGCILWIMLEIYQNVYSTYESQLARIMWTSISGCIELLNYFIRDIAVPGLLLCLMNPRAMKRYR